MPSSPASPASPARAKVVAFPSTAWFDAVRRVFNADEAYRGAGGGQCNCVAGVKITERVFVLTFEGVECGAAVEADDTALDDVDFFLDMSADDWCDMVANIAAHDGADLHHTLNTLDLGRDEGLAASRHGDQVREDFFSRYNQTLQFFFDASARVRTEFA